MEILDTHLFLHERDEAFNIFLDQYKELPHVILCSHSHKNKMKPLRRFIEANKFESIKSFKLFSTFPKKPDNDDDDEDNTYEDNHSNLYIHEDEQIVVNFRYSDITVYYSKKNGVLIKGIEKVISEIKEPHTIYPRINLLCSNASGFYLKEIKLKNTDKNFLINYNDDFAPVHTIIKDHLNTNKSGIILLHGEPGTGKTSYIKNLTADVDRPFIVVPQILIGKLSSPEFVAFLTGSPNSVLILEDAEAALISRDSVIGRSSVAELLNLSDGLIGMALNSAILATFNTGMETIDKAIVRKGRLVCEYNFEALEQARANSLLEKLGKKVVTNKDMILADIYNMDIVVPRSKSKRQAVGFKGPRV